MQMSGDEWRVVQVDQIFGVNFFVIFILGHTVSFSPSTSFFLFVLCILLLVYL